MRWLAVDSGRVAVSSNAVRSPTKVAIPLLAALSAKPLRASNRSTLSIWPSASRTARPRSSRVLISEVFVRETLSVNHRETASVRLSRRSKTALAHHAEWYTSSARCLRIIGRAEREIATFHRDSSPD
jgi:hypothetical protein